MAIDLSPFFEEYAWSVAEVETGLWVGSFATDWEEDFDMYAMASDVWVRLAITPLLPRPTEEASARLAVTLLRLNQRIQLVRFAVDDEGDVCLLADLPAQALNFPTFQAAVDMLVVTTQTLARPLARMAMDPQYRPPELEELLMAL